MFPPWSTDDEVAFGAGPTTGDEPAAPRFCERCRKAPRAASDLCPECGDRLELQGYCPVCEGRWKLKVGDHCPKHELELIEARPERGPAFGPKDAIQWTTVWRFPNLFEAEAARLRLDAEGIPTLVDGERMASNFTASAPFGSIPLQVPRALASRAVALIREPWAEPDEPSLESDAELPAIDNHDEEPAVRAGFSPLVVCGVLLSMLVITAGILGLIQHH